MYKYNTTWIIPIAFAFWWDGIFWSSMFAIPLSIALPLIVLLLWGAEPTLVNIDSDGNILLPMIRRWCDTQTIFVWFPAGIVYGVLKWDFLNLIDDKNLPLLILC